MRIRVELINPDKTIQKNRLRIGSSKNPIRIRLSRKNGPGNFIEFIICRYRLVVVTGNINNRKSNNAKLIEAYLSDFLYFIHAGHTLFNLEIRDNGDKQREKREEQLCFQ